ncbi:carbohydrate porin [Thiohalocapsa marina]|uniref:Carbohydrate porin n=2 Tax=Thiohalocapsa marina TaxID=424902 RepID=A0A5M8FLQ6_9GAMM|nr:carbohydrate porin [Thiohalocapsa marina]
MLALPALALVGATPLAAATTDALEQRIAELQAELEQAKRELADARMTLETVCPDEAGRCPEPVKAKPEADKITLGPLTVGGAIRANYVNGDYPGGGSGPSRGGNGGNFELDVFRINVDLNYENIVGKLEYRWYDGYNFLHTGWVGYNFDNGSQVQVGVNRVPFGPGAYGVSQSWFFDQHYYLGLADDMDVGIKYVTSIGDWDLDFAYYARSEWNGNGTSEDSARYSYDSVIWESALDADGNVIGAAPNGYEERNQFNIRAIYGLDDIAIPTEIGVSLQYGQLHGRRADDGDHWAASVHMKNSWNNWLLATQLTRYKFNIDDDNLLGTDELIPMGAFDFAWPAATDAWVPAVSLSYLYQANRIPWLDSVRPYVEYSSIVKEDSSFNDSELFVLGAAWARQGWYIYTDAAWSNGNYFVGSKGDNYSNILDGVGDFGANGNDRWNFRFNINFGYYF